MSDNQKDQPSNGYNFYQTYSNNYELCSAISLQTLYQFGGIQNMGRILEAGAGTGSIFPFIIQAKKQTAEYHSIDISYEFLQAQQQRLEQLEQDVKNEKLLKQTFPQFEINKLSEQESENKKFDYSSELFNIHLHKMNMEELAFPDNHFDGYFESLAMHHSNWNKSLSEATRVLKSGGKLALLEFTDEEHKRFRTLPDPQVEVLFKKLYQDNYKGRNNHNHEHNHEHKHEHKHENKHEHQHQHQHSHSNEQKKDQQESKENKEPNYKFDHNTVDQVINVLQKDTIVKQLEQKGYENVYLYNTFIPYTYTRENFLQCCFLGREPKSPLSEEEQKVIRDELWTYFIYPNKKSENPELRNLPNGMNVYCVLATKK